MRRLLFVLLVLNGLLLPLTCVPTLFLCNAVNPMQLVFIAGFTVENRTASTVYVTPVGKVGPEGDRCPLPMVVWQAPWVPAFQRGRFPVQSGETITLYFDWDDVNFSELVVETEDGELRQLVVSPVPGTTDFVIDDLSRLGAVDPQVREAHAAAQRPVPWWPMLAVTSAPAVTFLWLRWWYRRLTAAPAPSEASLHGG